MLITFSQSRQGCIFGIEEAGHTGYYLIAEGLLQPYEDGKKTTNAMQEPALARVRQLSAHEIGHTLGFNHNFAASPKDRAR